MINISSNDQTSQMTSVDMEIVPHTKDEPVQQSSPHRRKSKGAGRAHYQSINNTNGAFFAGSTPASSVHAGKMLELMAATQGHQPTPSSKRNQNENENSVLGKAVVWAGQRWLMRWRSNRLQREEIADEEPKDGALAVSQVRVNGMVRKRTKDDVQYVAETEHGSMSVSVPNGSPESKVFDRVTVPEASVATQKRRPMA